MGKEVYVVGDCREKVGVYRVVVIIYGEALIAGDAILHHTPETLDAAFGLRAVGSHEGDAELREGPAELRGLAFTGELFFDGPVVVVADEDAAVVTVKSERNTVPAEQLMKQAEIAESGFRGKELRRQDFAGGVVLHAESSEVRAAAFEPVVRTAVELHEFSELCGTHPALAMRGSPALSRGTQTLLAQQSAKCFATERNTLAFHQLFAEMVVVEAGVGASC